MSPCALLPDDGRRGAGFAAAPAIQHFKSRKPQSRPHQK
jgi:hypothetical protein